MHSGWFRAERARRHWGGLEELARLFEAARLTRVQADAARLVSQGCTFAETARTLLQPDTASEAAAYQEVRSMVRKARLKVEELCRKRETSSRIETGELL